MYRDVLIGIALFTITACCNPRAVKEHDTANRLQAEGTMVCKDQIGTWTYYHSNGKLKALGDWLSDLQTGTWKGYFADGTHEYTGAYINGPRVGE